MSRMISTEVAEAAEGTGELPPPLRYGIVAGEPPALLGTAGEPLALAREETPPQLHEGIVAGGPPALLGPADEPLALATEERPRQMRLFPPPKPLTERFGAEFFRAIPEVPGVYRMFDGEGRIIYIGQSQNLRDRLNSYRHVHPERDSRKTVRLVHEVRRIEWEICDSPASARLRENELLRTVRPRFNRVNVWPWACFYLAWRECPEGIAAAVPPASPPASSGGVSPPGSTRGETPRELAAEDGCGTGEGRESVHALELALLREPAAGDGWACHGAFKGGAKFAYAGLLRLLCFTLGAPARIETLPLNLLGSTPPREYRIPLRWADGQAVAPLLRAYLAGHSTELVAVLLRAVTSGPPGHRFEEALLLDDLLTLESFFRTGPQRGRRLRFLHGLPEGLMTPEQLVDLLAVTERAERDGEPELV